MHFAIMAFLFSQYVAQVVFSRLVVWGMKSICLIIRITDECDKNVSMIFHFFPISFFVVIYEFVPRTIKYKFELKIWILRHTVYVRMFEYGNVGLEELFYEVKLSDFISVVLQSQRFSPTFKFLLLRSKESSFNFASRFIFTYFFPLTKFYCIWLWFC